MVEDLKKHQMHSKIYRCVFLFLILPFSISALVLFFIIFLPIDNISLATYFALKNFCIISGMITLVVHSVCALIAAPHSEGYKEPKKPMRDPLIDYFPGQQEYKITYYGEQNLRRIK